MTITTVGYGDIFPHTTPGKVICIITALWGAIMISLLVLTASSFFDLSGNQLKAMKHIRVSGEAAKTISLAMKYYMKKKELYKEKLFYQPNIIKKSDFLIQIKNQVSLREQDPPQGINDSMRDSESTSKFYL